MKSKLPLFVEIYGTPSEINTESVQQHRQEVIHKRGQLAAPCPFTEKICQKSTFKDPRTQLRRPMAVCTISDGTQPIMVCPERFKTETVFKDVATQAFGPDVPWLRFDEQRLPKTTDGISPGNVDHILVACDEHGQITDFCAVEVQAVYFSGKSIRDHYLHYMMTEEVDGKRPFIDGLRRPDYRSSSKKRLLPQILSKGPFFATWGKKLFIVIQEPFFKTLPQMTLVPQQQANIIWISYNLQRVGDSYELIRHAVYPTSFQNVMNTFLVNTDYIPPVNAFLAPIQASIQRLLI